jgi:hypothetical protein
MLEHAHELHGVVSGGDDAREDPLLELGVGSDFRFPWAMPAWAS